MAQLSELPSSATQLQGALQHGLDVLDLTQQVTFQVYSRVVLPLDGFVFWQPTVQIVVQGSLHYSQEVQQEETETVGFATVLFTSKQQVQEFTDSPQNTLYVASVGDDDCDTAFRFAFSQQQGFYTQAGVWHYFGHSVYPALASQLLDTSGRIDPAQAVVSNSFPLWLQVATYAAPYFDGFKNTLELFPSLMVQENLQPPYGVVHIPPEATRPLQAVPLLDINRDHYQLAADKVRVTLYGLQNNAALDFLDCVLQYSRDTGNFGIMNMPIVLDGKRPQPEIRTLGMQKFIDFEVSYYQTRVNTIARQLILSAIPTLIVESATGT